MIRGLLAIPFLVLIVLFALSNQQTQRFSLWPTDLSLEVPLSLAVLGVALVFFVAGGLLAWGSVVSLRARLRRTKRIVQSLEAELAVAKAQGAVVREPARRELALAPPS